MNIVFRRVDPVYDMNTYKFKMTVLTKQAKYEYTTIFVSSFRAFNM